MKKILLTTVLLTGLISSTAFYLFPDFPDLSSKIVLAISFAILIPQVVAIWAFLTSLGLFKRKLKAAYYLLALGIVFLSLNQLQLPLSSFITFDPIGLSWFITGSTLAGDLLVYLSMRTFARLLAIKSGLWGSFWIVAVFALTLALAASLIPHLPYPVSERTLDGIFGLYVTGGGFAIAAAVLAWQIRRKLGQSYKKAMGWLVAGGIVLAFSAFHETLLRLLPVFSKEPFLWYSNYGVSIWPLLAVACVFLMASLLFRKVSRELPELPEDANALDIINYTAQLVSDPKAIDPILDKVRTITARGSKGATLSASDEGSLVNVYYQLETYLVTKDPLLKVTKEDLRARLPEDFRRRLGSSSA